MAKKTRLDRFQKYVEDSGLFFNDANDAASIIGVLAHVAGVKNRDKKILLDLRMALIMGSKTEKNPCPKR